jgi:DNA-directed RNA polymerase subunit RPC12/RpoP
MQMSKLYDCPQCGAEVEFTPEDGLKFCRDCGALLELDADAEFIDGMWRDLSKVIVHKQEAEL